MMYILEHIGQLIIPLAMMIGGSTYLILNVWQWWKGRHKRAAEFAWMEDAKLRILYPAEWNQKHGIEIRPYNKKQEAIFNAQWQAQLQAEMQRQSRQQYEQMTKRQYHSQLFDILSGIL